MKRLHSLGVALTFAAACASVWGQVPVAQAWALTEAQDSANEQQAAQTKAAETDSGDSSSDDTPSFRDDIDELLAAGDYAEGEAMATVTPDIDAPQPTSAAPQDITYERILTTTGDVFEDSGRGTIPREALQGAQDDKETVSAGDVAVETYLVRSGSMTTRELLELLATDPRVLDASPNYRYDVGKGDPLAGEDDEEGAVEDETAENDIATESALDEEPLLGASSLSENDSFVPSAARDVTTTADASRYQWAYSSGAASTFGGQRSLSAVLTAYNWNTAAPNASGVVAVFDTGVDYNHPDLAGSMMDMSPYVSKVGGTSHGYNAVDESAEPLDDVGHGTHVAGTIAAATNGFGVSGTANGVKLLPVKAGDTNGWFYSAAIQRGYAYLARAVQAGVDLRVVNNSWSGPWSDPALELAVSDLGALGVLSVFAAGNDGKDVSNEQCTATALIASPYVLTVGSLNMDGTASPFSNRSQYYIHLFAPGGSIMSTTRSDVAGTYLSAAMRDSSSTYVSFSSASDSLSASTSKGAALGSRTESGGFDETGGCLSLTGAELNRAYWSQTGSKAAKRIVLDVPVDESKLSEASMAGCAVNFKGKTAAKAWLEVFDGKNWTHCGEEDETVVDSGNWTTLSLDLNRTCALHNSRIKLYHDASGKAYIKVSVCLNAKKLNASTAGLKIDCVGIGSTSWHYGFKSGTSMATPAVSGLAAIMMSEIPGYTGLVQCARAAKVASLMGTTVNKLNSLAGLCWSSGVPDPAGFENAIKNDNQPHIGDVTFKDDPDGKTCVMTLVGLGFGDKEGTLSISSLLIDGTEYEILSWSDTKIEVRYKKVPFPSSGSASVKADVTNRDSGKTSGALSTSVLGGEDKSDDSGEPSDPSKPSDPSASGKTGSENSGGKTVSAFKTVCSSSKTAVGRKKALADTGDRTAIAVAALAIVGVVLVLVGVKVMRTKK